MRLAAIDLGTNSTRLLIADLAGGSITDVLTRSTVTRMGEDVDSSGAIGRAGIERVFAVLDEYRGLIDDHGATDGVAVLTSAGRDAANGQALAAEVAARFAIECRVIDGSEEARLVHRGATAGRIDGGATTVVDIGGGSTEVAIGEAGGRLIQHASTQLGVVRQTERHLHDDPPAPQQITSLRAEAARLLTQAAAGHRGELVLSVGGTPVSCALMLGATSAHGTIVTAAQCELLLTRLGAMSRAELEHVPGLLAARAPAIVAGLAIQLEALAALGASRFEVCERDLRHGALIELAERGRR